MHRTQVYPPFALNCIHGHRRAAFAMPAKDLRLLRRSLLGKLSQSSGVALPPEGILNAPARVLQFGTGRFLRAFADWMLQRAAAQGAYRGRAILVQSTGAASVESLHRQDCLYTVAIRGAMDGHHQEEFEVVGSVASAFVATLEWAGVLATAAYPNLNVVISNTTEVGLTPDERDAPNDAPPRSFPGKLTAWLYRRYTELGPGPASRALVLPCELLENNGELLRAAVEQTAARWDLPTEFAVWLRERVAFCNTLVDRIVTGYPPPDQLAEIEGRLGYRDALLDLCEPYHLWAIQAEDDVRALFPLHQAGLQVIYAANIIPHRERKLRLLNGTHTLMAPMACLLGHTYVCDAMDDPLTAAWAERLLMDELVPTLPHSRTELMEYAETVLARFRNPYLRHRWEDILQNTTAKIRIRVVPSLLAYAAASGRTPTLAALGLAAWIVLILGLDPASTTPTFAGPSGSVELRDREAADLRRRIRPPVRLEDVRGLVRRLLAARGTWDADLAVVPGMVDAVSAAVADTMQHGPRAAMQMRVRL